MTKSAPKPITAKRLEESFHAIIEWVASRPMPQKALARAIGTTHGATVNIEKKFREEGTYVDVRMSTLYGLLQVYHQQERMKKRGKSGKS